MSQFVNYAIASKIFKHASFDFDGTLTYNLAYMEAIAKYAPEKLSGNHKKEEWLSILEEDRKIRQQYRSKSARELQDNPQLLAFFLSFPEPSRHLSAEMLSLWRQFADQGTNCFVTTLRGHGFDTFYGPSYSVNSILRDHNFPVHYMSGAKKSSKILEESKGGAVIHFDDDFSVLKDICGHKIFAIYVSPEGKLLGNLNHIYKWFKPQWKKFKKHEGEACQESKLKTMTQLRP